MLQCFWPDKSGKFPWEPECAQWAIDAQPLLYKSKEKPRKSKKSNKRAPLSFFFLRSAVAARACGSEDGPPRSLVRDRWAPFWRHERVVRRTV
jgi:hypothetical protein